MFYITKNTSYIKEFIIFFSINHFISVFWNLFVFSAIMRQNYGICIPYKKYYVQVWLH